MFHFPSQIDLLFAQFCRTGDLDALGKVFDASAPDLLRIAMYVCRDVESARDVVQETFVAAIESRDRYQARERAMPWLLGILTNKARHARRALARRPAAAEQRTEDPVRLACELELRERLADLSAELGEPHASVLALHLEQGLNAKEIAARLSRPAGTVRTQLMRALDKVREHLPTSFVAGALAVLLARPSAAATATLGDIRDFVLGKARNEVGARPLASSAPVKGAVGSKAGLVAAFVFLAATAAAWAWWPEESVVPIDVAALQSPLAGDRAADTVGARRESLVPQLAPLEPLPAEPGFASLRVRVRWANDGSPAQGVTVVARNGRVVTQRDAVTGHGGVADLHQMAPGEWSLETDFNERASSLDLVQHEVVALRAAESRILEFVVRRTGVARGRVEDANGWPVADAMILMWPYKGHKFWASEVARSGADGEFAIALPAHEVGVCARKTGYAPSVAATGTDEHIVLQLRANGGDVQGIVVDAGGRGVPGALVVVGDDEGSGETGPIDTRTAVDGGFRIDGLAQGRHRVRVRAVGFAFEGFLDVAAGRQFMPPIVALATGTVRGTVRDEAGRAVSLGVDCGDLRWRLEGGEEPLGSRKTTSDESGNYELTDMPPGRNVLFFGHPTRVLGFVELPPGGETTVDVVVPLRKEWTLSGRVRMTTGEAVSGLRVEAWHDADAGNRDIYRESSTRVDGAFERPGVVGPVRMTVYVRDYPILFREVPAGSPPFEILLRPDQLPSATIRGRLLDATGAPTRGEVQCGYELGVASVTLDAEGAFAVTTVPPGRQRLFVTPEGWDLSHHVATIDVSADAERDLGTIPLPRPSTIEARVTGDGRSVVGGTVQVAPAPSGDWTEFRIFEGSVSLVVPPGRWRLVADLLGARAAAELEVVAGTTNHVALDLRPTLAARVVLAMTEPRPDFLWRANLVATREDGTFAGAFRPWRIDGGWSFEIALPADRYHLSVTTTDDRKASGLLDLREGGAAVTLRLPPR